MDRGKYTYLGSSVKYALGKSFYISKITTPAKKLENNRFRVPSHFATICFTFEKFPPPPPLLHPNVSMPFPVASGRETLSFKSGFRLKLTFVFSGIQFAKYFIKFVVVETNQLWSSESNVILTRQTYGQRLVITTTICDTRSCLNCYQFVSFPQQRTWILCKLDSTEHVCFRQNPPLLEWLDFVRNERAF